MDEETLRTAVETAFEETGRDTPSWPSPRPTGEEPREEEYSRCLDPGKYLILRSRLDAWVEVLTAHDLAAVEDPASPAEPWRGEPSPVLTRTLRLRPGRVGAVPLTIGFRGFEGGRENGVVLGAGEPAVEVTALPDCGCDACDDGSDGLLRELDSHVHALVSGSFLRVETPEVTVVSLGSGWSASFRGHRWRTHDVESLLAQARSGRSRHPTITGPAWWS